MRLEQKTIDHVRNYWNGLNLRNKHDYMVLLYRIFLNRYPQYKKSFHHDMEVVRNNMTMSLGYLINNLEQPNKLDMEFGRLGKIHKQLAVTPEMFDQMLQCQLEAQQHVSGDRLTDEDQKHWKVLQKYLVERILSAYPED